MGIDLNLLHSVEGLSRVAAGSVVSGLWQGLVLAAAVWICLWLMPKTTAAIRFAVWTAGVGVLAIAALWLAVSMVRAVKLVTGAVQLRGIWKRATPVEMSTSWDSALAAAG